jgi:hypothetical protein
MLAVLLFGWLLGTPSASPSASTAEAFLAMGIRQMEDGEFESAVFALDTAVRKMTDEKRSGAGLARAFEYLGAAYAALAQDDLARAKFRAALRTDPSTRMDATTFPARTVKLFSEELAKLQAVKQGRKATKFILAGGVGALGAIAVAVSSNQASPPPNHAPTASIGVSPQGTAIVAVTVLEFTADASDPDNDTVSLKWDFGDGARETLPRVRHVYMAEGQFTVTLTATDSRGASTDATVRVTAGTLTGRWREAFNEVGHRFRFTQIGPNVSDERSVIVGTLADPRRFTFSVLDFAIPYNCAGEVNPTLSFITTSCPPYPRGFEREP